MGKVTRVESAAIDHPECGVKRGETYYWWIPGRRLPKRCAKNPPRQSETTESPFWKPVYLLQEQVADLGIITDPDELRTLRDDIVDQLEFIKEEAESSLENLPEYLKEHSLVPERISALEEWMESLVSMDSPTPPESGAESDEWNNYENKCAEFLMALTPELGCS